MEAYCGAGARGEELPVEDPGSEVAAAEEARHLTHRAAGGSLLSGSIARVGVGGIGGRRGAAPRRAVAVAVALLVGFFSPQRQ